MAAQDDPQLLEAIEDVIDDKLFGTRTAMLCRVLSYKDTPRPLVSVQIAANKWERTNGDIKFTPEAQLMDVPVMELAWGPFVVRATLERGDHGVLLVADRDIDTWITQQGGDAKGQYNPGIAVIHDINDALFLPAIQPNSEALLPKVGSRELVIGTRDGTVKVAMSDAQKTVEVEATTQVKLKALRIELEAFAGIPGGPFNLVGVNAAGLCTHVTSAAGGGAPVVWTPNPAGQVVIP